MDKSEKYFRKFLKATERTQADSLSNAWQSSSWRVSWHTCRMWPAHGASGLLLAFTFPLQADVTLKRGCEPTKPISMVFPWGKEGPPHPQIKTEVLNKMSLCVPPSRPLSSLPPPPCLWKQWHSSVSRKEPCSFVLWKLQMRNASVQYIWPQNRGSWGSAAQAGSCSGRWVTE